jgi:hypothetical protein
MILEKVLLRLRPESLWKIYGDSIIDNLHWLDANQTEPSREEIEAEWTVVENEVKTQEARAKRDRLLADSDWVTIRATDTGNPVPTEWQTYRQALRDITEQTGFPENIDWPEIPGTESEQTA